MPPKPIADDPMEGVDEAEVPVDGPKPILRLSEDVINQIAAAEIIHRPSSAIKELLENSLDAGSTSIKIQLKEGGLKMLSVGDNGCGIRKKDLPLLCLRYATSKLSQFSDLQSIATYGFRGEALASISYVSRVTVLTKVKSEGCGWKAHYLDGQLVPPPGSSSTSSPEPKPSAANDGTTITAEDLFYNSPLRRKAFKTGADEFNRVMDVVTRYAIHNPKAAWVCKKSGSTIPELSTPSSSTTQANISLLFGSPLGRELLEIPSRAIPKLGVEKVEGWVSNANWNQKRFTFVLFINHRLVESTKVKKAIETLYQNYLPKGTSPFVYISLEIEPHRCDVNVHPTKQEVHFLDEDAVVEGVIGEVSKTLVNANASRTFSVQTLLPGARDPKMSTEGAVEKAIPSSYKPPPKQKVRIDPTERTLESMDMFAKRNPDQLDHSQRPNKRPRFTQLGDSGDLDRPEMIADEDEEDEAEDEEDPVVETAAEKFALIEESHVALKSVNKLRAGVKKKEHRELTDIVQKHTFVGLMADKGLALFQSSTKLYLLWYDKFGDELFYQLCLKQFGAMNRMKLEPAPSLRELLSIALDHEPGAEEAGFDKEEVLQSAYDKIYGHREMMDEYFSLTISPDGNIANLPMALHDYTPTLDRLPFFLLCIGMRVDWNDEMKCFENILREIAYFYSPIPIPSPSTPISPDDSMDSEAAEDAEETRAQLEYQNHQIEHVIFPAMKRYAVMPKDLLEKGYIKEVANLPDLYRIFERC